MHPKQDYKTSYTENTSPYELLNRIDRLEEMVSNLTNIVKKQQEKETKMAKEISTQKKILSHLITKMSQQSNMQSPTHKTNTSQKSQAGKQNYNAKNVSFQQQPNYTKNTFPSQLSPQSINTKQTRATSASQKKSELRKSELNMGASISSISGSKILMNQLIDLEEKQATLEGNLTGSYVDYETLHANNRHKKNLYGIIYDLQRLNKPDYETDDKIFDDSDEFDETYQSRRDSALDIMTRIEYLQQKIGNPVNGFKAY